MADTKKPRTMPGLFCDRRAAISTERSVLGRDRRSTPVEAIDDFGLDGLDEGLEGDVVRPHADSVAVGEDDPVVLGQTVFGLHEPARRGNTEDVERVLDAAADEPAVTTERGRRKAGEDTCARIPHGRTRPFGAGVTGVDVAQDVRSDQVAQAGAGSITCAEVGIAREERALILNRAGDAAELAIAEDTEHP